jgi:hypothetical protein
MSPEQALGIREIDHRSDLYALAVLSYECLTGTLPFDGENELSIIQMQAHMPPPDLLQRAPWIPKPVADVVVRALSKSPDDRYPSAGEFHQAMAAARDLAGEQGPLEKMPSGQALRASGEKPRLTAPAVPAGMGLAALQAEIIRSGAHPAQPQVSLEGPSTAALTRALRSKRPLFVGVVALVLAVGGGAFYALNRHPPEEQLPEKEPPPDMPIIVPLGINLLADAGAVASADGGADDEEATEADADAGRTAKRNTGTVKHRGDKGTLNVVTTLSGEPYWAAVLVDGVRRGTTPMLLELPVGRHQIRIERMGFKSVSQPVRVSPGRTALVRLELNKQ